MLKQVNFFRRRRDLSVEAFREYWRTQHAQIVSRLPGLVRYSQNHAIASPNPAAELPFDGVAETWFEDIESMRRTVDSAELKAIQTDETNFIDPASMGSFITEEITVIDGAIPTDGPKLTGLINHLPSLSVETFRQTWRDELGPIVKEVPGLVRYVQGYCRLGIYRAGRTPAFDGIANLWFPSAEARDQAFVSAAMQRANTLERTFIDFSNSALAWVEEVQIIE